MEGWDGGDAVDVGSEPDKFGWISDNPDLVWTNLQFIFEGIIILAAVTLDCLKYVQKK